MLNNKPSRFAFTITRYLLKQNIRIYAYCCMGSRCTVQGKRSSLENVQNFICHHNNGHLLQYRGLVIRHNRLFLEDKKTEHLILLQPNCCLL